MPHDYKNRFPAADFTQKGNGFHELAEAGIIMESYRILEYFLDNVEGFKVVSGYHQDFDWLLLERNNKKVMVAVSQGTPMAADLAERYLTSGAKKIARIGTTGALVEGVGLGDTVISYAAIKDDGTSPFYISPDAPAMANIAWVNEISNALRDAGQTVHNGIAWTTDGRWRIPNEKIAQRIADGAIVTDMETSALYAFGLFRKVPMASVSLVSDEVYTATEEKDRGLSDRDVWFDRVLPGALVAFNTIVDLMTRDEPPVAVRPESGLQNSGNGNDQRKTL